jgi:hypothetical protein
MHHGSLSTTLQAKVLTADEARRIAIEYEIGGIVGLVDIVDCKRRTGSPWHAAVQRVSERQAGGILGTGRGPVDGHVRGCTGSHNRLHPPHHLSRPGFKRPHAHSKTIPVSCVAGDPGVVWPLSSLQEAAMRRAVNFSPATVQKTSFTSRAQ